QVANTLLHLARAEAGSGDLSSASEHYQRSIDLYQKIFDATHPDIGDGLDGLGHLKALDGELDQAEALFSQALKVKERAMGNSHPRVAEILIDIARIDQARADRKAALKNALQAEDILRAHFGQVIRGFSEREALAFQRIRQNGLEVALSVMAETPP